MATSLFCNLRSDANSWIFVVPPSGGRDGLNANVTVHVPPFIGFRHRCDRLIAGRHVRGALAPLQKSLVIASELAKTTISAASKSCGASCASNSTNCLSSVI